MQLVREVKGNPQVSDLCIWADGGAIYLNREHRKRGGLSRGSHVFSFGPLVFRCLWDISTDVKKAASCARVTNCAALCSLQPGRPLKDGLTDW